MIEKEKINLGKLFNVNSGYLYGAVKKLTAILFLLIYLFSTPDVYQLLKIQVVFEHYREHKALDQQLSFIDYVANHYLHGSPTDYDHVRDMQLPFKTPCHFTASISAAFIPDSLELFSIYSLKIVFLKIYISNDIVLKSNYLSRIWQPPKFS
ncbi:hypothetical protein QG516_24995 [Pedobacter gandavensis]|uniref:hypothetical protein n=1 Tax=Pedobacter gandavensis TaxID=2679963 RepID=UPI0024798257|nr:hypothetical protein [Pedobacter gandavensis]WGQ09776.1 hypothetical protein QG516_24995 [Pedobacter gandavensis]